jgi:hypothetical protein
MRKAKIGSEDIRTHMAMTGWFTTAFSSVTLTSEIDEFRLSLRFGNFCLVCNQNWYSNYKQDSKYKESKLKLLLKMNR